MRKTHVNPESPSLQIDRDLISQALTRGDRTLCSPDGPIVIVGPVEEVSVRVKRGPDVP